MPASQAVGPTFVQIYLVDGFGVLHPQGSGSASNLGVLTGTVTFGIATALLHITDLDEGHVRQAMVQSQQCTDAAGSLAEQTTYATPATTPTGLDRNELMRRHAHSRHKPALQHAGSHLSHPLVSCGRLIDRAVRIDGSITRPVYVSVGHICLQSAVFIVRCCSRCR